MAGPVPAPIVSSVKASTAFEGYGLVFRVKLTGNNKGHQIAWNYAPVDAGMHSVATQGWDWRGFVLTDGVTLCADNTFLIVPPNVTSFDIVLATQKDAIRETSEYVALNVGGVAALGAIAGDMPYDAAHWWRNTSWFHDVFSGRVQQWRSFWLDPANAKKGSARGLAAGYYGAYVQRLIAAFDANPRTQNYADIAAAIEFWMGGKVTGAGAIQPVAPVQFMADAVVSAANPKTIVLSKPPFVPQPDRHQIVVLGDSITDEETENGTWTRGARAHLSAGWSLRNVAHAGSTTRSGFGARNALLAALAENPTPGVVAIATGHNNFNFRVSLSQTRSDLEWLVKKSLDSGASVLLIGTYLPPNMQDSRRGHNWSVAFHRIFEAIAQKYAGNSRFAFVNNLWAPLDGSSASFNGAVAQSPETLAKLATYLKPDRVHPRGEQSIVDALYGGIAPKLDPLVSAVDREIHAVALDQGGGGLGFSGLANSRARLDVDGDGVSDRLAWMAAGTAFLVRDENDNGVADGRSEIDFAAADGASGLDALRIYDTNNDGLLSAAEADYWKLGIWTDANGDGRCAPSEFKGFAAAGIQSLALSRDAAARFFAGGDVVAPGQSAFTRADGTEGALAGVTLAWSAVA